MDTQTRPASSGSPAPAAQQTVWLVSRGEDPGATPCVDEPTARRYAEYRYLDDEHPDDTAGAVLTWDDYDTLLDRGQDTGWAVSPVPVIRPADIPNPE